jgi:hypothetical protein
MNRLGEAFGSVGTWGLFGSLFTFAPLWAPQVVFRRLVPNHPRPGESAVSRFSVSDGFVLFAFLALSNGLVRLVRNEMTPRSLIGLAVWANLLVVLIWIQCQRFMWTHRILQQRSRMLMQIVLYPLSVVAAAEMFVSMLILLSMLEVFFSGFVSGITRYFQEPVTIACSVVLGLSILAVRFVRYLFRRFIVLGSSESRSRHASSGGKRG